MSVLAGLRARLLPARRNGDALHRLERQLRRVQAEQRDARRLLLRTQGALDALLRHAYVDPKTVPYPQRLTLRRFGTDSQNGEDGMLLALLAAGGAPTPTFAEIAAGTNGGNSGFLARELGWSGLMVDGSEENVEELRLRFNSPRVRIVRAVVTRENVDELLRSHELEGEMGLLSIDIDGNDLWVWEAVEAVSPRIVIVEYNALFGPTRSVAVPYDSERSYQPGGVYYGASLRALTTVSARKGYRLVAVEPRGSNAFFLRADVAPEIPATSPEEAFAALLAPGHRYADPIGPRVTAKLRAREAELDREIRRLGLPLIEIEDA